MKPIKEIRPTKTEKNGNLKTNVTRPIKKPQNNSFKTFTLEISVTEKCNLGCP